MKASALEEELTKARQEAANSQQACKRYEKVLVISSHYLLGLECKPTS
jgi:hypothetical protein